MSKREEREARKAEREAERAKRQALLARKRRTQRVVKWGVIVLAIAFAGWWLINQSSEGTRWPYGSVHWHAKIDIRVCGEPAGIEDLGSESVHYGGRYLHTHGDNLYHLEGNPGTLEQASLGAFFDAIGVPFSNDRIYSYTTGDQCPNGTPGMLEVLVNGEQVANATAYVPADGDEISITFG